MFRLFVRLLICSILFSLSSAVCIASPVIIKMRMSEYRYKTRLVLDMSSRFHYRAFTLSNPDRLVVDLPNSKNTRSLILAPNRLIKRVLTSQRDKQTLRLVFELRQRTFANIFTLPSNPRAKDRLVIDLSTKKLMVKQHPIIELDLPKVPIPKRKQLREVIIAIDAGHGGKDPGAMGTRRSLEKDIVLAIAKRLKDNIDKIPGMRAIMTRNGDYYVSLRNRLAIARKKSADIFIAIHADAYANKSSHGASVFALSQRGASSEAARWLAERENHSELGDITLSDKSHLLRSVLIDLSQTATIMSSLQLGQEVLEKLSNITDLHNQKVEQARFVVLKSPDIPSLLVETGFISNINEEKRLSSARYQQLIADAITRGIKSYFWAHAPHGSWLALQEKSYEYEVAPGDTLDKIARHYHVSVAKIKELNKLRYNELVVGHVLMIPHPKYLQEV